MINSFRTILRSRINNNQKTTPSCSNIRVSCKGNASIISKLSMTEEDVSHLLNYLVFRATYATDQISFLKATPNRKPRQKLNNPSFPENRLLEFTRSSNIHNLQESMKNNPSRSNNTSTNPNQNIVINNKDFPFFIKTYNLCRQSNKQQSGGSFIILFRNTSSNIEISCVDNLS